jgi:hypothetical protein
MVSEMVRPATTGFLDAMMRERDSVVRFDRLPFRRVLPSRKGRSERSSASAAAAPHCSLPYWKMRQAVTISTRRRNAASGRATDS